MKALIAISKQDFFSTFRDPIFRLLLIMPVAAFAILRWVWPMVVTNFPIAEPYGPLILMLSCMQAATMFGFIYGFLFLEEKEENVFQVFRIIPFSTLHLITARLAVGLIVSSLINYILLHWGGIASLPLWQEIVVSIQFSLMAPWMALLVGAFAANKIQGLAQMKIINLVLNLPALVYLLPYKALHATAVIPTYWAFRTLEAGMEDENFILFTLIGFAYFIGTIVLLSVFFQRKAVIA